MKPSTYMLTAAIVLLIAPPSDAVVGFVNRTFVAGDNLFANPLQASPDNTLGTLVAAAPEGTSVSLWNPVTRSFDTTSTFTSGAWSANLLLNPGIGARLTAPSAFVNTFVGEVLNHDGSLYDDDVGPVLPPVFTGPDGIYLLGDKLPVTSTGTNIFLNILGRLPTIGEQVRTLSSTSTYLGGGDWDLEPSLAVGEAVFLNVGPVPEPNTLVLALVGALALLCRGRQLRPMATYGHNSI